MSANCSSLSLLATKAQRKNEKSTRTHAPPELHELTSDLGRAADTGCLVSSQLVLAEVRRRGVASSCLLVRGCWMKAFGRDRCGQGAHERRGQLMNSIAVRILVFVPG